MSREVLRRRGAVAAVIGGLVLPALFATPVHAAYDPLSSGATKLILDKGFLALLKRNGVKLSATEGARLRAGTVVFPVSGGKFDSADAKGTVDHEGTVLFRAGGRRIPLRALLLKTTQRHSPFSVKVGGGQLKLAEAGKLAVERQGFGSSIRVSAMKLSAKVATRMSKKLHLRGVFEPGLPLGAAVTKVNPLTVALRGKGRVSLDLDPAFAAKLESLFVAVNPIFPAEHPASFTLPIFGGTLATDASTGRLDTQGALEFLQLGGGQVFWREADLDFSAGNLAAELEIDPSPPYAGKLGPAAIAPLTRGNVSADSKARTISIAGGALVLGSQMADVFNEVFAKSQGKEHTFVAGETLGTFGFSAKSD